jgi:hypothetical protein
MSIQCKVQWHRNILWSGLYNQNANRKTSKEDKNPKEKRKQSVKLVAGKSRPGSQGREWLLFCETRGCRSTLSTRKINSEIIANKNTTGDQTNNLGDGIYVFPSVVFELGYSEAAGQNTRSNTIACPKRNKGCSTLRWASRHPDWISDPNLSRFWHLLGQGRSEIFSRWAQKEKPCRSIFLAR